MIVGCYVDDIHSTGNNDVEISEFRSNLKKRFKCSEGGLLDWSRWS